jgi:hypothetical protein
MTKKVLPLVLATLSGGWMARSLLAGAMLAPGQPFPAWQLPDQTGAKVSSADLKGQAYLLWYFVKASTPG